MGTRQLLFVTYRDENLVEGFAYAVDLARAMGQDITVLLVKKSRNLMSRLEDVMTAITFAEAGEPDAARDQMSRANGTEPSPKELRRAMEKCAREGVDVKVEATDQEVVAAIRAHLESNKGVDKVVLSPGITEAGQVTPKQLSRLVRTSSRPIVTITKRAAAAQA